MRLLDMADLADMLGRVRELEADAPAMRAGRKRRPLITVTSCGMSACAGSWVMVQMPDCRTISSGLYSSATVVHRIKLIDDP
jgi:hypothetical protein